MPVTLRTLLDDPHPSIRRDMQMVLQGLRQIGLDNDRVLDQNLETTVTMLQASRMQILDKDEQLSYVDKALLPLLQLHRVAYLSSSNWSHLSWT